ncbi:MAG TPA: methyltransferase domain-containing protein [Myxococcales bacterium]|nr:methyltransferase domain-containing protein [Myxococcales bacterium]
MAESRYIHGTAPEEQARLSRLNQLLNDAALRELRIAPGDRIVDFGCGLAQLTRAMARKAGIRAVGLERSAEQIAEALRQAREEGEEQLLELREGDVLSGTVEEASYDLAHARFVLEHVPDPLAVVRAMVRSVRPGGRIVLQDDDHDVLRVWPEPPGLRTLWQAYMRTYDRLGNDPIVGRRLVALLHEAGARPVRSRWLFFGACAGEDTFPAFVENLHGVLDSATDAIVSGGLLGRAEVDETLAQIRRMGKRQDGALWYAVAYAEGIR